MTILFKIEPSFDVESLTKPNVWYLEKRDQLKVSGNNFKHIFVAKQFGYHFC